MRVMTILRVVTRHHKYFDDIDTDLIFAGADFSEAEEVLEQRIKKGDSDHSTLTGFHFEIWKDGKVTTSIHFGRNTIDHLGSAKALIREAKGELK